jgi:hypothetical protein
MYQQGSFTYALCNLLNYRRDCPGAVVRLARNRRHDGKRGWWWRIEFGKKHPRYRIRVLDAWGNPMS